MKESVIGKYLANITEYQLEVLKRMAENKDVVKRLEENGVEVEEAIKNQDFDLLDEVKASSVYYDVRDDLSLSKDLFKLAIEELKKELDMVEEFAASSSFVNIEELTVIMIQILGNLKNQFENAITLVTARDEKDDVIMFGDLVKSHLNFIASTHEQPTFESLSGEEFDNACDIAFKVIEEKLEEDGVEDETKEKKLKQLHHKIDHFKNVLFDEDDEDE